MSDGRLARPSRGVAGRDARLHRQEIFVFQESDMSKGLIVLVVLVVIVLALFGQYVGVRNQLVAKDQAVKAAWSQVDIVLQRRADLIPNLVETVKGYAQQEVTVFGDIAKARSALLSAQTPSDKIAANGQLDGAIGEVAADCGELSAAEVE
jgi:LemA protein